MSIDVKKLISNIKQPTLLYTLQTKRNSTPNLKSHIGGHPYTEKDDRLPICRSCKDGMDFVFQLHIPHWDASTELYAFYYCFACKKKAGNKGFEMKKYLNPNTTKTVHREHWASPIQYSEFIFTPSWSLPDWHSLPFVDANIQQNFMNEYKEEAEVEYETTREEVLETWNFDAFSFYGGYPNFLGFPVYPTCTHCDEKMELFIQLDTEDDKGMTWNEFGCLHIFKCKQSDNFQILIQ